MERYVVLTEEQWNSIDPMARKYIGGAGIVPRAKGALQSYVNTLPNPTNKNPMVTYGAVCSWWDDKEKAGTTSTGLPCCPYCMSPLFEIPLVQGWNRVVTEENRPHWFTVDLALWSEFLEWSRDKCRGIGSKPSQLFAEWLEYKEQQAAEEEAARNEALEP
jgi:hypothetical protein